ncbi:MAG: hypothetical protein J5965_15350, partial [Aeriscardovia sp.]|nr:hypothetical protein [Aeriscardovia sp.]
MDFNSLGTGSPFYILTKHEGQKPILEIGTVKEKVLQQPQYQLNAIPNAMNGMGAQQQMVRIVATINGSDRVVPDIPVNVEIAAKGDVTYTGSTQAMMQAVDAMMQTSKAELEREAYNRMVLGEGEKFMETLNPRYAEEKKRDRTIQELVEHRKETDS